MAPDVQFGIDFVQAGGYFPKDLSIEIQIQWSFYFALTSTLAKWYLSIFVDDTSALLAWHLKK